MMKIRNKNRTYKLVPTESPDISVKHICLDSFDINIDNKTYISFDMLYTNRNESIMICTGHHETDTTVLLILF